VSSGFQVILGLANLFPLNPGPYRPPSWGTQPQLYSMTCTLPAPAPIASVTTSSSDALGGGAAPLTTTSPAPVLAPTTFYFDAVLRAEHSQEARGTEHPVQVGPAIIDHIYLMPAEVVLEVGMSDAMDSFLQGQYSAGSSKSVSAYKTFKQIQATRVPITLTTRLDQYQNMYLRDVRGTEDARTRMGFRGTLHFRQLLTASIGVTQVSVRASTTDATNEGVKSVQTLDPTTLQTLENLNSTPSPFAQP
jgi:hypothetical protein